MCYLFKFFHKYSINCNIGFFWGGEGHWLVVVVETSKNPKLKRLNYKDISCLAVQVSLSWICHQDLQCVPPLQHVLQHVWWSRLGPSTASASISIIPHLLLLRSERCFSTLTGMVFHFTVVYGNWYFFNLKLVRKAY